MKKNKYTNFLLFISIFTLLLISGCSILGKEVIRSSGDYQWYANIDSLGEKADLIIEGKVVKSQVKKIVTSIPPSSSDNEALNPGGEYEEQTDVVTISDIKINKVYKGDLDSEVFQVKQYGGETKDKIVIDDDIEYLEENKKYILFLSTYENSPASLLNPYQAQYIIDDNNNIKARKKNDLKLTIKKLDEF